MDNIQLCYIDNEINKIDKMKQGDVIYKNGMELLVVLSYDHEEPCRGRFRERRTVLRLRQEDGGKLRVRVYGCE